MFLYLFPNAWQGFPFHSGGVGVGLCSPDVAPPSATIRMKSFSCMLLSFFLFAMNIETCFVIVSCISQLRGEPKPMMLLKLLSRCQWGKLQLPLGSNPDVLQSRCPPFFLQVSVQYKSCRLLVLQDRATGSSGSKPEGIIELWWHSVSMYLHHFSPFHEC